MRRLLATVGYLRCFGSVISQWVTKVLSSRYCAGRGEPFYVGMIMYMKPLFVFMFPPSSGGMENWFLIRLIAIK